MLCKSHGLHSVVLFAVVFQCRDIEKMQRKLSQQQTAGVRVSRQMDQSQRELVRTNSQLKQQSLSIRKGQPLAEKEEFKLPRLNQPKANPTKRRYCKFVATLF